MNNDSFVFYKSFFEAIEMIPIENQLDIYKALCNYSFNGEIPNNISGTAKAMFILMKPNIDSATKRYNASVENGKKGGAPKGNQNARKERQPKNNLKQPKNNLNDNVDVDIDVNVDEDVDIDFIRTVIDYLNLKTSKSFKYTTKSTRTKINARLNEGFNIDDFKTVIDKQTNKWLDDQKMNDYLRPETLFGTKFEGYLNSSVSYDKKSEVNDALGDLYNETVRIS